MWEFIRPHLMRQDEEVNMPRVNVTKLYVVTDEENGYVMGPFESEEEAKNYFIASAFHEGFEDVIELINSTGSPFNNDDPNALHIAKLAEPDQGMKNLGWWIGNNLKVASAEGFDPEHEILGTVELYRRDPSNFSIPED